MILPKLSIVTPSFNQGRFIEQTICSVLNQNYPNLEYVIIDGGSTDETISIIKKYEKHLAYWVSEPDKGQTDAINKGFAKCTGEIFNWINSDDYYEPNAFRRLGELFLQHPDVNVVCGREWYIDESNGAGRVLHEGSTIKKNVYQTLREGIIVQPPTFFRTGCIRPFFPLDTSLKYVMDRQLWWHYLLTYGQNNILKIPDVLNSFRLHSSSKSISDAARFELEFDRLRLSLLAHLKAPELVCGQVGVNTLPSEVDWGIIRLSAPLVLAEFAAWYAERNYVQEELQTAAELMRHVMSWRKGRLNKKEWKLWLAANVCPQGLLFGLKKIKGKLLPS